MKGVNKINRTRDGRKLQAKITQQLNKLQHILAPKKKDNADKQENKALPHIQHLFCVVNERELFCCIE